MNTTKLKGRPKRNEAALTVTPEMENWFNTIGKRIERTFITNLCAAMEQARRNNRRYAEINVEGIMNLLRYGG